MKRLTSSNYLFLYTIIIALCMCGCATKNDVKDIRSGTAEPENESAQAGPADAPSVTQAVLEDISVTSENGACRVSIISPKPPSYTVFRLSAPDRIIVDLPEMQLSDAQKSVPVDNEFIKSIESSLMQDRDTGFVRVEINLKKDCSYNAHNTDNAIVVDLSSPVPAAAEETGSSPEPDKSASTNNTSPSKQVTLKEIHVSETPAEQKITIVTDAEIKKYQSFPLSNPNRLALDFPKAVCRVKKPYIPDGNTVIDAIRTGQKADSARIVIDLKTGDFPPYQISQVKNSLTITLRMHDTSAAADPQQQEKSEMQVEDADVVPMYTGEKISLDFKDADLKNVLRLIADISGLNIIVSDNVQGKVTLKLDDIPWDEAFDIILETNNLGKIVTRNIVRIETTDQIKRINDQKLQAKQSRENIEELIHKTVDVSYAKARDLESFISKLKILSPRGSVNSFTLTNKITIQDIPENVEKALQLIREQDIPTRQVLIEARIVQSNPGYVKEMGIRWGGLYNTTQNGGAAGGGADIGLSGAAGDNYLVNLPAAAGEGAGGAINFGYLKDTIQLDVQLSALEKEDKLKIISNPRILGLDNKEARIKQGVALPYLKLSQEGVTSTEFKDAVLELEVTPKITPANTVALHIMVTKNQKSAQTGAGNEPGIDVREVETDLLVASGKTVVIGGIYETQKSYNVAKVPFLADMPYLGRFFRSEKEEENLTEILVFLTVTVVEGPGTAGPLEKDV